MLKAKQLGAGLVLKAKQLGAVEAVLIVILIPLLVLLGGRFFGSDGEDSSQQSPRVASAALAPPVFGTAEKEAPKPKAAALPENRGKRVKAEGLGDSRFSSGGPSGSAPQPADAGGRAPAVASPPKPPPKPPPAPPQPVASQPPPAPPQPVASQPSNPSGPSTPPDPTCRPVGTPGKPVGTPGNGPCPDGTGPPGQNR